MEDLLKGYFPNLTDHQVDQFKRLKPLYEEWNAQINVISRKDIDGFNTHHLLHSLALSFYWQPKKGQRILDIGTGGGFPGIPLAIMFPDTHFVLVDSIGKKIKVVKEVAEALGLKNIEAHHERAESMTGQFDMTVTRAVARLSMLTEWCTRGKFRTKGIYCLKGGDLREEVEEVDRYPSVVYNLKDKLGDPFFETKKVVYVQYS
jgi:16S rRNA (guanine527-N7)-methyltransferase